MSNLIERIIRRIQGLADELKKKNGIINEIIRDDVLQILQACDCTVLYFPLDDGDGGCDGCHLVKPVNGRMEQFVFINTNNTRERQAFTAAHELGHVWKVDERLKEEFPDEEINDEVAINRFAAELLMPENFFVRVLNEYLKKISYAGPKIKLNDLVKVIAYLMNYFFVPYKSVVLRLNEVKRLDERYNEKVLDYKDSNLLKDIIMTEQYTRLGIKNKIKSMDNLQEYLLEAEEKKVINATKANNIRNTFDILKLEENPEEDVTF